MFEAESFATLWISTDVGRLGDDKLVAATSRTSMKLLIYIGCSHRLCTTTSCSTTSTSGSDLHTMTTCDQSVGPG